MPDLAAIIRFAESLPPEYRASFSEETIALHRGLSERRGQSLVEVGAFGKRDDLTGVCIVAADSPGLLSRISEAFVVCGMDVVEGEAFTRDLGDHKEAVDTFWIRLPTGESFTAAHTQKLRATLQGLFEGHLTPVAPVVGVVGGAQSNSTVRFLEDAFGALCTLEIETEDRSGLLLSLSRALYAQRVQILRSEVRTKNGRVFDRFVIAELDGAPVGSLRRLEIQVAILSAAEPAKRLSSPA